MTTEKTSISRVRLNNGGYDDSGRYWGVGQKLYRVDDPSLEYSEFYRADSREEAKEQHSHRFPNAVYYR
jgi:hypothetical protein